MTHEEIVDGLQQLGFDSGWVVTGNEISLWINEQTQPTLSKIQTAAKLWNETKQKEIAAKEAARQVLLDKLGITSEEAKLLLG
jgi:hypothetical protein